MQGRGWALSELDGISSQPTSNTRYNWKCTTFNQYLILNGENYTQTTIQRSLALKQKSDEQGHTNHELITIQTFGFFYPSSIWRTELGPIRPNVLRNLYEWLVKI